MVNFKSPPRYLPLGSKPLNYVVPSFQNTSSIPLTSPPPIKLESGFPGVKPLTFDFMAQTRKAYEALRPFYNKLLEFAGGNVDLAKRMIQYSYDSGMRQSKEEYEASRREQAVTFPTENEQLQTKQNRRGILTSGFGKTQRERLQESQNLRREAVQRALENRQQGLTARKGFGMEEQERKLTGQAFDLETQRRKEAAGMAQDVFGVKRDIFGAQLSRAGLEENRRIRSTKGKALEGILGGGGDTGGFTPGSEDWKRYLREHGRQNELDKL